MNDLTGIISVGQWNTVEVVEDNGNVTVKGISVMDNNGCLVFLGVFATDDEKGNLTIHDTAPCVLVGIISAGQKLLGNISSNQKLLGSISSDQKLVGYIGLGDGLMYPEYEGEFDVTPSVHNDIVLNTAETYVNSDIKINKILYAEVSNNTGGKTVTIGSEV